MKLLNLGCGYRYHQSWTNVDFISTGPNVLAHNLLQGTPFDDNNFDVVYHSHVLEHFNKGDGKKFIQECYRVLKPGGVLRIAVPNLEQIARLYLQKLEEALAGNEQATDDYEWIMLEMYDQTVRNQSGGDMAKYLFQAEIPNEDFVYTRIGEEGRQIRKAYLSKQQKKPLNSTHQPSITSLRKILGMLKRFATRIITPKTPRLDEEQQRYQKIGKFRLGGEIHQWMYDRYSLRKLLTEVGFKNFAVKTAFDSQIPHWNSYELEAKDGVIFKPDSLFVEANK